MCMKDHLLNEDVISYTNYAIPNSNWNKLASGCQVLFLLHF
jgi:hypothetical protein